MNEIVSTTLNKLPEVRWDRFTVDKENVLVFGWISRDDGKYDFVFVEIGAEGPLGIVTSSARFSAEFSSRLFGPEDNNHVTCKRVEDHFPGVRCVRIRKGPQK